MKENSRRSGRVRVAENFFQVELASVINLSESFVIVEEAALRVESVHCENGCWRSISEWI